MTLYETIQSMSIEELAEFLAYMQQSHEEDMFKQLTAQGVDVTLVRELPQVQVENYIKILDEEVDDGTW